MDASTRWETEALRSGGAGRTSPPRPSAKNAQREHARQGDPLAGGSWVTLREAEAATGIPTNTLRKWVRRAGVSSYLESDGETQVRMIDLDAVVARAAELGRDIEPAEIERVDTDRGESELHLTLRGTDSTEPPIVEDPRSGTLDEAAPSGGETMIVPIDAWNKMLTQLGNLHEAGQQLADARERAAKAETEAEFLRQRLAEIRAGDVTAAAAGVEEVEPAEVEPEDVASEAGITTPDVSEPATTSYWRYVTTGWRSRKRR
jgi:hypothetical protein